MNSNIGNTPFMQACEAADQIERLSEFARAFTAIEDLMRPADSSTHHELRFVGRDELTSLIGVVNNAFKRQLEEVHKMARAAAHAIAAPDKDTQ